MEASIMKGTKDFINCTRLPLKVVLTVRCDDRVGTTFRVEEFCLEPGEKKCVHFGNECNPFLDGIRAFSKDKGGCTETALFVNCKGSRIDRLLNNSHEIKFLKAAESIVISSDHC